MRKLLRAIASTKTTLCLLLLLAVSVALGFAGPKSNSLLKSAAFDEGLASWPTIAILLLLLVNQLAAFIKRLVLLRAPKVQDDFDDNLLKDSQSFGGDFSDEWDETPTKKPLPPMARPEEMAFANATVETVAPADNAKSLLETLGFRITKSEELGGGREEIHARQGGGRGLFTLAIHAGVILLTLGVIAPYAVYPSQQKFVFTNQTTDLKTTVSTPYHKLLKSISLAENEQSEYPSFKLSLLRVKRKFQQQTRLTNANEKWKRWEEGFKRTFMGEGKLKAQYSHWVRRTGLSAELALGGKQTPVLVPQGKSVLTKAYNLRVTDEAIRVKLNRADGAPLTSEPKKALVVGEDKLYFIGLRSGYLHGKGFLSTSCVEVFHREGSGKKALRKKCVPIGGALEVAGQSLTLASVNQGVVIRYQRRSQVPFFGLGLALFLLGFIGFCWPTRHFMQLEWSGENNSLRVEGSGLNAQPQVIALGFERSLHLPKSMLPQARPTPRGGSGGGFGGGYGGPQSPASRAQSMQSQVPSHIPAPPAGVALGQAQAAPPQQSNPTNAQGQADPFGGPAANIAPQQPAQPSAPSLNTQVSALSSANVSSPGPQRGAPMSVKRTQSQAAMPQTPPAPPRGAPMSVKRSAEDASAPKSANAPTPPAPPRGTPMNVKRTQSQVALPQSGPQATPQAPASPAASAPMPQPQRGAPMNIKRSPNAEAKVATKAPIGPKTVPSAPALPQVDSFAKAEMPKPSTPQAPKSQASPLRAEPSLVSMSGTPASPLKQTAAHGKPAFSGSAFEPKPETSSEDLVIQDDLDTETTKITVTTQSTVRQTASFDTDTIQRTARERAQASHGSSKPEPLQSPRVAEGGEGQRLAALKAAAAIDPKATLNKSTNPQGPMEPVKPSSLLPPRTNKKEEAPTPPSTPKKAETPKAPSAPSLDATPANKGGGDLLDSLFDDKTQQTGTGGQNLDLDIDALFEGMMSDKKK